MLADRSPSALRRQLMESNLLAHHLEVLERVGLIEVLASIGDRRARYLRLLPSPLEWCSTLSRQRQTASMHDLLVKSRSTPLPLSGMGRSVWAGPRTSWRIGDTRGAGLRGSIAWRILGVSR